MDCVSAVSVNVYVSGRVKDSGWANPGYCVLDVMPVMWPAADTMLPADGSCGIGGGGGGSLAVWLVWICVLDRQPEVRRIVRMRGKRI